MKGASSIDKSLSRGSYFNQERYISADSIYTRKDDKYFYIRAHCRASKEKKIHDISLALHLETGCIMYAMCTCVAGKGGLDNHTGALLQEVAAYSLEALPVVPDEVSRTSITCSWTVRSSSKDIVKKPIMQMSIDQVRPEKKQPGISCTLYEARSSTSTVDPSQVEEMRHSLMSENRLIAWAASVSPDNDETKYATTEYGPAPVGSLISHQLSPTEWNFKAYCNLSAVPRTSATSTSAYPPFPLDKHIIPLDRPATLTDPKDILSTIAVDAQKSVEIEESTRSQANSPAWHTLHHDRITASTFGRILQRKRKFETLASEMLDSKEGKKRIPKVLQQKFAYGKLNEPIALEMYHTYMERSGCPVSLEACGLIIPPDASTKVLLGLIYSRGRYKFSNLQNNHLPIKKMCKVALTPYKILKLYTVELRIKCQHTCVSGAHNQSVLAVA